MAFALAGAIRTAYPMYDALPGNWGTDMFIDTAWPAVGASVGVLIVLVMGGVLLFRLASELQGPGLAQALARKLSAKTWAEWLDVADPGTAGTRPELRQRYEDGELTDPLAPLFEMAVASIQGRRYAVIEPVLGEVRRTLEAWFLLPDGDRPHTIRSAARLVAHFNDLLEAGLSSQAVTPIETAVRNMEQLALSAVARGDSRFAVRIMDELAHWVGRLANAGQPGLAAACIHAIRHISTVADTADDMATFEQCVLALGRAGEEIAAAHKRQPERLLHADYGDLRHDAPLPALTNALEAITEHFTTYGQSIKGELHNARFVVDGLLVAGIALLKAPEFDSHTDRAARDAIACLARLGLVAAKTNCTQVFEMVVFEFEKLVAARQSSRAELLDSIAYYAFELGLNAENQPGAAEPYSAADRIATTCRSLSRDAVKGAVSTLSLSGQTTDIPNSVQQRFVLRLENKTGWNLR
jgi:hypothetical protein